MKMIGLQIAIGLAIMFGSPTAGAEAIRSPINNPAEAAAEHMSSRHRGASQRHHHRLVRIHKRKLLYSGYPNAPWHSRDYFPRWRDYHPQPILIVYRQ